MGILEIGSAILKIGKKDKIIKSKYTNPTIIIHHFLGMDFADHEIFFEKQKKGYYLLIMSGIQKGNDNELPDIYEDLQFILHKISKKNYEYYGIKDKK